MPSLELQASPEQKAKWMSKCESLEYIGCYAQTEIAHGSNVRGIEIEARYNHATQEFTFHSPTITATKWWVGGLGLGSTHALLVARLIINGSDYGPNAFFIQIRDLKTHEPLPGVEVGDIGPKMGNHGNDNGFLRFEQFKQPKEVMLNRFAKINDAGEYEVTDPNAIKILYLSLIRARSALVFDAWYPLACALTIAIRYSLIREQFPDPDNPSKERKILDYQAQKFKLFRVLSRLYCFIFIRPFIKEMYRRAEEKLKNGDDSDLAFLHCIISLYKSYVTFGILDGIEECRRSCGGHGFLMLSGLPSLYLEYLPAITYDGDNSILILQSARYYMNTMRKGKEVNENLLYLHSQNQEITGEAHSALLHQNCFELAARQKFQRLLNREKALLAQGKKKNVIWNKDLQVEAIEACEAGFYASVHKFFAMGVNEITDPSIKNVVETVRQVFAVSELEKFHGELVRAGARTDLIEKLKGVQLEAFEKLRPDALGLVEVFEIPDEGLNSVIARTDGKVYEHMLRASKYLNPLNKDKVFSGIRKYLTPKI
jgi:acyl-CoA oxidase